MPNSVTTAEEPVATTSSSVRPPERTLVWAAALSAGLSLVLGLVLWFMSEMTHLATAEVVLIQVILSAVIILTLALGALAIILSRLRLTDRNEALGLPAGTIRAVLALLLIVLFVVTSIFLFGQLRGAATSSELLQNVTRAELSGIPLDQQLERMQVGGTADAPIYNVRLKTPVSSSLENFASQLLTTMSTLVVAISSFYFGSRAVDTARRALGNDSGSEALVSAEFARAGKPGRWLPAGAGRPDNLAALIEQDVIPVPEQAWADGEYVELGDGSKAVWNGAAWAAVA